MPARSWRRSCSITARRDAACRHRTAVARRDRGRVCGGASGRPGCGAAAFRRPVGVERGRRTDQAAGEAGHPLHADAGRSGLCRRGFGTRPRADHSRGRAVAGADPRFRPRIEDAARRDACRLRRDGRDARHPPRRPRDRQDRRGTRRRSTARAARSPSSSGPHGRTSASCSARSPTSKAKLAADPIERTAIVFVGPALAAGDFRESSLYDPAYQRRFRGRDAS